MGLAQTDKGKMFIDTNDNRDLLLVHITDHKNGEQTVEFVEMNPLGYFVEFNTDELESEGIVPKFP